LPLRNFDAPGNIAIPLFVQRDLMVTRFELALKCLISVRKTLQFAVNADFCPTHISADGLE